MCVQYHGGVQYRGDIVSTVGDILSTVGDIMMHMGDIMSTVEGVQYCGGKSFVI